MTSTTHRVRTHALTPNQYLALAKTNRRQAHRVGQAGFTMDSRSVLDLDHILALVDDEGNVQTDADFGVTEFIIAVGLAVLAAFAVEGLKGDDGGVRVEVNGNGNQVTVQSCGGGDAEPDGGDGGDGGGDGGDGGSTDGGGTDGGGSTDGGGGTSGGGGTGGSGS